MTASNSARVVRVCAITSVHRPFDQRIFYKEACSLSAVGYDVTLIAPSDIDHREVDGVILQGVPRPRSRWNRPMVWLRLVRHLVRLRPDVVHFHDPELLLIVPLLRLMLGRQVRVVYDVHEYVVDSIAHKVWIPRFLRGLVAWIARGLERALGRTVDGLIFVIEDQVPLYEGWRARWTVVHNYPDEAVFADPVPLPDFPPDRFRLIYVGSLYARRGIMTMLEALVRVVSLAPETLLILGGAFESEDFRVRVETFIADHDLGRHVVFVGWIDHSKLKDYLASADVAWLPGLPVKQYQRRGISTKQLESMLMGLSIVSSDHPHRRIFVEEAECGSLVDAVDPAAHADAILWLYHHPDERRAMGARGRQLVQNKYNWRTEAATLLEFYDRLLRN